MTSTTLALPHYHVGSNVAGYVPEGDIALFSSEVDAIAYSKSEADRALEEEQDHTEQDAPSWSLSGDAGDYWLDNDDAYHIPTHFWVNKCDDPAVECACGTLACLNDRQDKCDDCGQPL